MATSLAEQKVACLKPPRSDYFYCSVCGVPMSWGGSINPWLDDIVVMHGDANKEVLIDKVEVRSPYSGESVVEYDAWTSFDYPEAIPMHKECLMLTEMAVESLSNAIKPFQEGGPPASLLDVYRVLIGRVLESEMRIADTAGLYKIFSPGWYGGIGPSMHHQDWGCGDIAEEQLDALLISPTTTRIPIRVQNRTLKLPLPTELVQLIFDYSLEDLSEQCNYIFPVSMWQKHLKSVVWMQGLVIPEQADYEQLARQAWQIERGTILLDVGGLSNRFRIWKLILDMRFNDMYDLRVQYCKCGPLGNYCGLWLHQGDNWCYASWPAMREETGLPPDWRPDWWGVNWYPPRFNDAGKFEFEWAPEPDDEIGEYYLHDYE